MSEQPIPHQHHPLLHLHPGDRVLDDHPPPHHGLRVRHLQ